MTADCCWRAEGNAVGDIAMKRLCRMKRWWWDSRDYFMRQVVLRPSLSAMTEKIKWELFRPAHVFLSVWVMGDVLSPSIWNNPSYLRDHPHVCLVRDFLSCCCPQENPLFTAESKQMSVRCQMEEIMGRSVHEPWVCIQWKGQGVTSTERKTSSLKGV